MQNTPSSGHDPALPDGKQKRSLSDIHGDALTLAGLLHILDQYDPDDQRGRGGVMSLIEVAEERAWKLVDDLEEWP